MLGHRLRCCPNIKTALDVPLAVGRQESGATHTCTTVRSHNHHLMYHLLKKEM